MLDKWNLIEFRVTEAMAADNDFWVIMEDMVKQVESGEEIADKQLEAVIQKHLSEVQNAKS